MRRKVKKRRGVGGDFKQCDYYPRSWRATVVRPAEGNLGKLCLIIQISEGVKCKLCLIIQISEGVKCKLCLIIQISESVKSLMDTNPANVLLPSSQKSVCTIGVFITKSGGPSQ